MSESHWIQLYILHLHVGQCKLTNTNTRNYEKPTLKLKHDTAFLLDSSEPSKNCAYKKKRSATTKNCCLASKLAYKRLSEPNTCGFQWCHLWILVWAMNMLIWAMNAIELQTISFTHIPTTSQMIYHHGGNTERAMHCWRNVMAHKPWITAEFVTICCSMSVISNHHFFGQWSY